MSGLHVAWFRRDLRVHDHAALSAAAAAGEAVLALYIVEPAEWRAPGRSARQFDFMLEGLDDLDAALRARGGGLTLRTGQARDVLAALHARHGIAAIYTHETEADSHAQERDRLVHRWAGRAGVAVHAFSQDGTCSCPLPQAEWIARWEEEMARPREAAPERIGFADIGRGEWPDATALGLQRDTCPQRQAGGRAEAVRALKALVNSSMDAGEAEAQLSAHFAFGTLSLREGVQAVIGGQSMARQAGNTGLEVTLGRVLRRLRRRSHLLQATRDRLSSGLGLPPPDPADIRPGAGEDDTLLAAWRTGRTGFPFVDACMRAANRTGWLSARRRALLMAFAGYLVWAGWQQPAAHLGRLLADFEEGPHTLAAQAQCALTRAGLTRICNPVRQGLEDDADGHFIRRHVPELAGLQTPALHAPWAHGVDVEALGYPARIVDHEVAARLARERLLSFVRGEQHTVGAPPRTRIRARSRPPPGPPGMQLSLGLETPGCAHAG